jgi:hypothetical protein
VRQTQKAREREDENEGQDTINDEVVGIGTPSGESKRLPLKQAQDLLADGHPVCCEAQGVANAISLVQETDLIVMI